MNKNKTVASEQVYTTLKYNELEVNSPAIIIKKLMCSVVLGIDILTKCKAQIELDNGLRHGVISGRKNQLYRNDNEVNNGKRPTYTLSEIRRLSISIKLDHTKNTDNYLKPQQAKLLENVIQQHWENINIMNYRIHKRKKTLSIIPVSYTHLDVYKRQVL